MTTPGVDREDLELLHAEMHALFDSIDDLELTILMSECAETYRYFAVSALGRPPKGDTVNPSGIAPFRVLDPLKWLLEETA